MDKENHFVAASLSTNLINEIQSLEEKLSEQTHKKVVVIAYENDENLIWNQIIEENETSFPL